MICVSAGIANLTLFAFLRSKGRIFMHGERCICAIAFQIAFFQI